MEKLFFLYEDEIIKTAVFIAESNKIDLISDDILSSKEFYRYNDIKSDSAKISYLLGRYSSKQAYLKLYKKNINLKDIEIKNGVFDQPVITDEPYFDLSISHSQDIATSIVFDKLFPMGIDIEKVNESNIYAMKELTQDDEIKHIDLKEIELLTVAWCLKEALSKAIKTGFTIPINLFKIENLSQKKRVFECEFSNFSQYKGIAIIKKDIVTAIAYPQQLSIGELS